MVIDRGINAPLWEEVARGLWDDKPQFLVKPPRYVTHGSRGIREVEAVRSGVLTVKALRDLPRPGRDAGSAPHLPLERQRSCSRSSGRPSLSFRLIRYAVTSSTPSG